PPDRRSASLSPGSIPRVSCSSGRLLGWKFFRGPDAAPAPAPCQPSRSLPRMSPTVTTVGSDPASHGAKSSICPIFRPFLRGPPLALLLAIIDPGHRQSRRLHVRKHVSWTAWVTVGKRRMRCHTVDLSANGARLKPRGEIQPGTPVAVQFQPPDGPMMEVGAVVWRMD